MALTLRTLSAVTTTNGVATPLSATQVFASSVVIFADSLNTGNIYWGDSTVTTVNGMPIAKNMSQALTYDLVYGTNGKLDLSKIYLDTDTTANKARIVYFLWEGA